MASEEERLDLRRKLGEVIPVGGSEDDTNFTDAHLDKLLSDRDNDLLKAAYDGWEYKAAVYANLVTTSEGGSRRDMSDLHAQALKMLELYGARAGLTGSSSKTRIHPLTRS